ncbi:hypothetical protein Tco_0824255 [Tanacetum coccineum]|uniref:Ubiquitin-like domain-containing protein n=1 Tax=Tanacetum coccineum TaxID=301880 RepID=A0ABQ5AL95_9ASTR
MVLKKILLYSIIGVPFVGIVYENGKKEKKAMEIDELHKFSDATLKRVSRKVSVINIEARHGILKISLSAQNKELVALLEEEIKERLKYRDQTRRWEIFVNGRKLTNYMGLKEVNVLILIIKHCFNRVPTGIIDPIVLLIRDEKEEYHFVDNYLNFQEEENDVSFLGIVLGVEEESVSVYDTDIECVVEEIVTCGDEDVIYVDHVESLMIQHVSSDDFEEDINGKSHVLMWFGKSITIKMLEKWCLGSGNGGVSMVVRGGESGGDMVYYFQRRKKQISDDVRFEVQRTNQVEKGLCHQEIERLDLDFYRGRFLWLLRPGLLEWIRLDRDRIFE